MSYWSDDGNPYAENKAPREYKEVIVTLDGVKKNKWDEEYLDIVLGEGYFTTTIHLDAYEVQMLRNGKTVVKDKVGATLNIHL